MNDWQWWQAKLDGAEMTMSEGTPHAGFYRWPSKQVYGGKRSFTPVAYWPGHDGELHCRIGDEDVTPERGRDIWVSVGNHPVTEEAYRAVAELGQPWPDEHETVPMGPGHNRPPDDNSYEGLEEALSEPAAAAQARLEGPPIADDDEADRIANLADRLAELCNRIDDARKAEKKPHDEAAAAVQKKWMPLLLKAETYKNLKYKLLTPWFRKKEQQAKEEAEAAAAVGEAPEAPRRPRAGTRGRAMTLKSVKIAEITDYAVCLDFFKENPDVKSTVQRLATRAVRVGITVPGTKVVEESQAV